MRVALAASVAAVVAVGVLVAGCAGGVGEQTGLVLRSAYVEIGPPSFSGSGTSEAAARYQDTPSAVDLSNYEWSSQYPYSGTYSCTMEQRFTGTYHYLSGETKPAPWDPASDPLRAVAQDLMVASSGTIWAGNDAWGLFSTEADKDLGYAFCPLACEQDPDYLGAIPYYEPDDWASVDGLAFYMFLYNENYVHTMLDPWVEVSSVGGNFTPLGMGDGTSETNDDLRPLESGVRSGSYIREAANWDGVSIGPGEGGPGHFGAYDAGTYSALDDGSGFFERPLLFRMTKTAGSVRQANGYLNAFSAGLTIYWYEDWDAE